ncbi:MAG: DUF1449 family protein [Tepidisphaeraceae bacterium]
MTWLAWWNLIYLLPLGLALLYLTLYVATGIDFGSDADADADADHDVDSDVETEADLAPSVEADHDVDHDVDADHDLDTDHEVDHHIDGDHAVDHDHDTAHGEASVGHGFSLLSLLGFGRLPMTVFVGGLLLTWGLAGFFANQWMAETASPRVGMSAVKWSAPIAGVSALMVTSLLGAVASRLIPKGSGSSAKRMWQYVGMDAVAILPVNDRFGLARVTDPQTHIAIQVPVRTSPGEDPIASNETVKLMRYDRRDNHFFVTTPGRLAQRGGDAKQAAKHAAQVGKVCAAVRCLRRTRRGTKRSCREERLE